MNSGRETLLSILCSELWRWDSEDWNRIQFNENNTGELTCKYENNVWIACEISWKAKDPNALQQVITSTNPSSLISQFALEITLQKRRISSLQDARWDKSELNEKLLTDAAFQPKTYTLRLEQGRFRTPHDLLNDGKNTPDWAPWYAFRLVFDVSPYPPRQEWKWADEKPVPDVYKFWEWKEFCNRELPKEAEETGVVIAGWRWIRRTLGV